MIMIMMMMMLLMVNVFRVEMAMSTVWVLHRPVSSCLRESRRSACSSGETILTLPSSLLVLRMFPQYTVAEDFL